MKNRLQLLTVMLGVVLALAIVCSQVCSFQSILTKSKTCKTEQKQEKSQETLSTPSISLPSSGSLNLNIAVYYLFEILVEKVAPAAESSESNLHPLKLFKTLFRVIISPNAP